MALLGLVVLALACQVTLSYPQNCSTNGNCVSRIWSCQQQRSCTQADNFLLELDFHYREKRCREVIPLSKSVVQVDIDARCEKPSNFNDFFFGRRLNCRNMLRRGPPPRVVPAMACPSAQNVSDLVVEKCSWHCKHKRPVSRCFISFDPRNALGVQQKLDKCWIQEKCINNQMKAKTTCQTAPSSSTPAVTLAGSMLVTVTDPVTFLAQPNLQFALQDAIERMAPESDFSDVAIEIPSSNSLANKTKMVKVGFNASVKGNDDETSDEKALGAEMALQNISHDALVDAVNGALSSEGLTNLVEDAMLLLAPLKLKGPRSEDFESLVAMMHLYQKHLEEVRLELQEVQEDLTIQNLSHKDAEALREKHRSTQKRLSSIMASQEKMSQYIEDAVSKRSSQNKEFQRAWNASEAAAQELAHAKANLSSTKAELAALQAKQVKAEKEALQALRRQSAITQRLKANASRLALNAAIAEEELDHLEEQFLSAQEDLEEAEEARDEEMKDHGATKKQLRLAQERAYITAWTLGLFLGCMAIVIVGLSTALFVCMKRRMKESEITPITDAGGNSVVVGRPVHVENYTGEPPVKPELPTLLTSSSSLARCMESPMKKPKEVAEG